MARSECPMREATAAGIKTATAAQKQTAVALVFSLIGLAFWLISAAFGWEAGSDKEIFRYLLCLASVSGSLFVMCIVVKKVLIWRG